MQTRRQLRLKRTNEKLHKLWFNEGIIERICLYSGSQIEFAFVAAVSSTWRKAALKISRDVAFYATSAWESADRTAGEAARAAREAADRAADAYGATDELDMSNQAFEAAEEAHGTALAAARNVESAFKDATDAAWQSTKAITPSAAAASLAAAERAAKRAADALPAVKDAADACEGAVSSARAAAAPEGQNAAEQPAADEPVPPEEDVQPLFVAFLVAVHHNHNGFGISPDNSEDDDDIDSGDGASEEGRDDNEEEESEGGAAGNTGAGVAVAEVPPPRDAKRGPQQRTELSAVYASPERFACALGLGLSWDKQRLESICRFDFDIGAETGTAKGERKAVELLRKAKALGKDLNVGLGVVVTAAQLGNLRVLQWALKEEGLAWSPRAIEEAAKHGRRELLSWAHRRKLSSAGVRRGLCKEVGTSMAAWIHRRCAWLPCDCLAPCRCDVCLLRHGPLDSVLTSSDGEKVSDYSDDSDCGSEDEVFCTGGCCCLRHCTCVESDYGHA